MVVHAAAIGGTAISIECFAYALAKATGEPLLFKGNDFAPTDLTPYV